MKGMQKIKRGNGFRGVLEYAFKRDGIETGILIGGNMSGRNPREIAAEFKLVRAIREDAINPVWHNSLRLPKNELITHEKWVEIADEYMRRMGFTDYHPRIYVLHDDEDGQHIHIIASRISIESKLFLGKNENLISTKIISALEKDYKLIITKGADYDDSGKVLMPKIRGLKKAEIEKSIRTETQPVKGYLQKTIQDILERSSSIKDFIESLEVVGVNAIPNIASTGKMNGFSFRYQGINFKASELGDKFKWARLEKALKYEQTRDSPYLSFVKSTIASTFGGIAGVEARNSSAPHGREPGAKPNSNEIGASGFDAHQPDGATGVGVTEHSASNKPEQFASKTNTGTDDRHSFGNGVAARGSKEPVQTIPTVHERSHSAPGQRAKSANGDDRDAAAQASQVDDESHRIRSDTDRIIERIAGLANTSVSAPDLDLKIHAWRLQSSALAAPNYRVTLVPRVEADATGRALKHRNLGKNEQGETFYTANDVESLIPRLRAFNARGFDIYITPIDPNFHHIVIDDLDKSSLQKILTDKRRFEPCLLQESSENNFQLVIKAKAEKSFGKLEQSAANEVVQSLNQTFGDPRFSGVVHPFRMAGFSNKKEGKGNAFTKVIDVANRVCNTVSEMVKEVRERLVKELQKNEKNTLTHNAAPSIINQKRTNLTARFQSGFEYVHAWARNHGHIPDASRIDFQVCKDLLLKGFDKEDIRDALLTGSPGLGSRHKNPDDYALRTVENAAIKIANETSEKPKPNFSSRKPR